jgi:hypothetical protein
VAALAIAIAAGTVTNTQTPHTMPCIGLTSTSQGLDATFRIQDD